LLNVDQLLLSSGTVFFTENSIEEVWGDGIRCISMPYRRVWVSSPRKKLDFRSSEIDSDANSGSECLVYR